MAALIKALVPSMLLSWVVATLVWADGSSGGALDIKELIIQGHAVYVSLPLFLVATGLFWAIFKMME